MFCLHLQGEESKELLFYLEVGDIKFLWNIGAYLSNNVVLCPRGECSPSRSTLNGTVSHKSYCLECCSWDCRILCPLHWYNSKKQINIECKSQTWFPVRFLALISWKCRNAWLLFMFNMPCYSLSWISNWISCALQVVTPARLNNLLHLKWVYRYYSNMGQICPWCTLEECWDELLA